MRGDEEWAVPGVSPGIGPARVSPLAECLELFTAAIASGNTTLDGVLSDIETRDAVRDLDIVKAGVDALYLRCVAELDHRPGAVPGTRSKAVAKSFLVSGLNKSPGQAAKDVAAAKALAPLNGVDGVQPAALEAVGEAFAAGEITREHVDIAVRTMKDAPVAIREAIEAETGCTGAQRIDACLADQARILQPQQLAKAAKHLTSVLDPDREDRGFDPDSYRRRDWRLFEAPDGMWICKGVVDPSTAALIRTVLGSLTHPERGCPDTSEQSGSDGGRLPGTDPSDDRSPGQRDADALAEVFRMAMAADPRKTRREPTQVVVITTPEQLAEAHATHALQTLEKLTGQRYTPPTDVEDDQGVEAAFDDIGEETGAQPIDKACREKGSQRRKRCRPDRPPRGIPPGSRRRLTSRKAVGLAEVVKLGPVSPAVLAHLTCDALLQAVVLDDDGRILALGRSQRTASRAQRRALSARDQGCVIPGCTAAPADCDAHHVIAWSTGGPTDISVMAFLCGRHHQEVHAGVWTIQMRGGIPYVKVPPWHHLARSGPHDDGWVRNTMRDAVRHAHRLAEQLHLDLEPPDQGAA